MQRIKSSIIKHKNRIEIKCKKCKRQGKLIIESIDIIKNIVLYLKYTLLARA